MSGRYSKWLQKPRSVWGKIPSHMVDDIEEANKIMVSINDDCRCLYGKLLRDNNLDPDLYHPEIYINQDGDDFVYDKAIIVVESCPNNT